MNKTTLILIFGAVAVALVLVFSRTSTLAGTAAPGSVTAITPGSRSVQPGANLGTAIASSGSVLSGLLSFFSGSSTPNASVSQSGVLTAPGSIGDTNGNSSSLAAALNSPLSTPVQQISAQNIADEYGAADTPPSLIYDTSTDYTLATVPDTGAALDSPGLPGDVISSDYGD